MASLVNTASPTPLFCSTSHHLCLLPFPSSFHLKNVSNRRLLLIRSNCSSEKSRDSESSDAPLSSSSSTPASFASGAGNPTTSTSTYAWCAGIGIAGFLETSYLTYLKFTNSDAFCPVGGGNCGDVLNSDYAVVFGFPLPLIGMITYGLVAASAIQLARKDLAFGIDESSVHKILLGITTSMAAASGYFLYILGTKFTGASCSYCLASALFSFTLFFITLKNFDLHGIREMVGLQLCIASFVVTALSASYGTYQPISVSSAEHELGYFRTEITTPSSPLTLALARHLHSIGAKMYGAFWCSHCIEQKEMFGREAAKLLDYVECFPNGYRKGIKIAKGCSEVKIEGFPTWIINGQILSGEKELSELATASGFESEELGRSN